MVIKKPKSLDYIIKIIDYESVITKEDDYGIFYTHGYMDNKVICDLEEEKLIKDTK